MSLPLAHVVVVSDRAFSGVRPDETAPLLIQALRAARFAADPAEVSIVSDDQDRIVACLRSVLARPEPRLILTTGGTGVAVRDVTPEATRTILERELPGLGEAMRAASLKVTPLAAASRALAGVAAGRLVVNLPGSPRGAVECFEAIAVVSRHVIDLLSREGGDCRQAREAAFAPPPRS